MRSPAPVSITTAKAICTTTKALLKLNPGVLADGLSSPAAFSFSVGAKPIRVPANAGVRPKRIPHTIDTAAVKVRTEASGVKAKLNR